MSCSRRRFIVGIGVLAAGSTLAEKLLARTMNVNGIDPR